MRLLLFFSFLVMSGCSYDWLFFWEADEPVAAEGKDAKKAGEDGKQVAKDDDEKADQHAVALEMQLSKLVNRIGELEAQVRRQREDFHVLRKGLLTGLIPSDWQDDLPKYSQGFQEGGNESLPKSRKGDPLAVILSDDAESGGGKGFSGLSQQDTRKYEQKLAQANHHFRAGDYGKAILAYTEIGRDYSDKITKGSHLLWIGASWFRLKDYQSARKHLAELVKGYQSSPWVPEAEFLLAKTDYHEGYTEKSLEELKDIIRKYPKESIADRAKEELKRVEENL